MPGENLWTRERTWSSTVASDARAIGAKFFEHRGIVKTCHQFKSYFRAHSTVINGGQHLSERFQSPASASRVTLKGARVKELDAAGKELGLSETRCLDYLDGGLSEIDRQILVRLASELLSEIDPDVVITFGPDGFSGHPDHIAVGAAVTAACYEMRSATSIRLFHCHLPRSRMLLRDRLAEWVVELTTGCRG